MRIYGALGFPEVWRLMAKRWPSINWAKTANTPLPNAVGFFRKFP